jgi:hypothetical protein
MRATKTTETYRKTIPLDETAARAAAEDALAMARQVAGSEEALQKAGWTLDEAGGQWSMACEDAVSGQQYLARMPLRRAGVPGVAMTFTGLDGATGTPGIYAIADISASESVVMVRTPLEVLNLASVDEPAFCQAAGGDELDPFVAETLKRAGVKRVTVAFEAGRRGTEAAIRTAAALRDLTVAGPGKAKARPMFEVELLVWPAGTADGTLTTALRDGTSVDLDQLLERPIPPTPPGGFYFPRHGVVPDTYLVGRAGTRRVEDGALVCITPLEVEALYADLESDETAVRISSEVAKPGEAGTEYARVSQVVAMSEISNKSRIPSLSDAGFVGMNSGNAPAVVTYFQDFLAENLGRLPRRRTASRMGWLWPEHEPLPAGFVHGRTLMLPGGGTEEIEPGARAGIPERAFRTFRTGGTAEGWLNGVLTPLLAGSYHVQVTYVLAALASILKRPLHCRPIILQVAGESSNGKSSTLMVAASVSGSSRRSDIRTMRGTQNGVEALLGFHGDLMTCFDELSSYGGTGKDASKKREQFVYMVEEAESALRSNVSGGLRSAKRWSGDVALSGEIEITGEITQTGGRARALVFWGNPWNTVDDATAAVIRDVKAAMSTNFGWPLVLLVRYLLTLDEDGWDELRRRHRDLAADFVSRAPAGSPGQFVDRMSENFAVYALAGELLEREVFPAAIPAGALDAALLETWRRVVVGFEAVGYGRQALEVAREAFARNQVHFEGSPAWRSLRDEAEAQDRNPDAAVARVEPFGRISERGTSVLPSVLERVFEERNLNLRKAMKHWLEEGVIKPDSRGNATNVDRIQRASVRVVLFMPGVLEGDNEGSPTPPPF